MLFNTEIKYRADTQKDDKKQTQEHKELQTVFEIQWQDKMREKYYLCVLKYSQMFN